MNSEGTGDRGRGTGAVLVVAVAVVALVQSWQRWLDPIIDTGRDLYIPEQLARGAALYRDLRYQYPPLAPYLLALMPGRTLAAYTILGIAQSAVIAASLWIALRRNAIAATVAALLFVAVSLCAGSMWNFIFPYSYAATLGMMFLTIALAAAVNERPAIAFGALFLASWCKVEYAAGVALIVVVLAIARRVSLRQVAVFAAVWIASAAVVMRVLPGIGDNVFALTNATARRFFAAVAGRPSWDHALALLGIVAVALLLRRGLWWLAMPLMIPLAYHGFFRAWFFIQIALLVYALVRERDSLLAVFAIFSIAATLRVPFNLSPAWYGVVLIVPVYALIAYALFERWPSRAWLFLVAMLCARDLWEQHERWRTKIYPVVTARGTFYDDNAARARALNEFKPSGTLAVFPEGIAIDYLTRTTTTLSFHTFTPVETADPRVEDEILRDIAARPPDRVALVARSVREYGHRGFGVDYDERLAHWIFANYAVERRWPGLLDLRRR